MVCLVLDWQNAVDWIQRHLTKANVGPKKDSRDGRQQIVFQKYCRQLVLKYKILQSSSIIQTILDMSNKLRFFRYYDRNELVFDCGLFFCWTTGGV